MSTGIECLLARDHGRAYAIATRLDALNRERRDIESKMQDSALAMIDSVDAGDTWSLTMHHADWHPGVVGILASRLKDRFHRPVFAFATENDGTLRGSGRSISALHLRDALDRVDKLRPGLLVRFGGHAAAAGATLRAGGLDEFRSTLESVVRECLTPSDLDQRIDTDGALGADEMNGELAYAIQSQVWGQGFPEPRFVGRFTVEAQRVVAERHLKLTLACEGRRFSAIRFGSPDALPASIQAVYRLDIESYQGAESLQLTLEHCQPL
jgi:single-stranded-DNA-specific exonuclease